MTDQNATGEDLRTAAFFDKNQPTYPPARLDFVIEALANATEDQKLIDVGAGDGQTLRHLLANTPITDVTGLDVSEKYAEVMRTELGCDALCGSILDRGFVSQHAGQYDYVVIAAVLHHIVGSTRKESIAFAEEAVRNCLELVRPGGKLFIYEPCYEPQQVLTGVFWIKRLLSKVLPGRLEVGPSWLNFGEPIVSYYSPERVEEMVRKAGATGERIQVRNPRRLGGLIKRSPIGLVIEP